MRTHAEAAANPREPLIVLEPLAEVLAAAGLDAPEDLAATPVGEGHSNVTFVLSTGVVLRRPPRGPLPPSAHDVLREARLLRALMDTPVRVPRVLAVCEDPEVIGAPFYVMERVAGEVITDSIPAALDSPEQRARIADELIDALVELHSRGLDVTRARGLREADRLPGAPAAALRRAVGAQPHARASQVEEVGRWLAANLPASPPATIVHGDFRLGNTMFAARAPARLVAIFDWEMATIGDPLADVGYMLMHWTQAGDVLGKFNARNVTLLPGFPTRDELTARYEERSGRSVRALDWYVTLALWKAVVFMEGNYKRALAGSTDDPYLKSFGDGVVEIADRALTVTRHGF